MPDYKAMYFELFRANEQAIRLLTAAQLKAEKWGDDPLSVDYGTLYTSRYKVLRTAYAAWRKQCAGLHGCSYYFPDDYYAFTLANEEWLDDYALYMALKVANGMKNWVEWERPYRLRDKAALAALLHDSAKEISKDEMRELMRQYPQYAEGGEERPAPVWHGICAAILARTQWGVEDEAILSAIACHTAGKAGMSKLDKVVYLADMTSKERDWPGVGKLRKLDLFFVRHLETSTILPSTLMRSKVREIVTIFRSKSMADHCRPITSLRRNP